MPEPTDFVSDAALGQLIQTARREDLGPTGVDATSSLFVDEDETCRANFISRQHGVVSGLALLPRIASAYDESAEVKFHAEDGDAVSPGTAVASLSGPLRSVLAIERVALNFLGHLSGVASHTAKFVELTRHTRARIYDTRKTLPGLRGLQKYAVACGGGGTHRMGLYDAVLVKDNHLAHVPLERWTPELKAMTERARNEIDGLKFVMVEVDTIEQLHQVLAAEVDLVLLDNMPPAKLREAVSIRDRMAPEIKLEASGGITLETVGEVAEAGVDRISIGALTHSSANLDFGLDIHE